MAVNFGNKVVVSSMLGSLPNGNFVENTPIYALENTPELLNFEKTKINHQCKHKVQIKQSTAFTIDNVISKKEANTLIALTENLGYKSEAPGISTPPGMRQNKTVHWVSNDKLLKVIFSRIQKFLPPSIDGNPLFLTLSNRINFYKYDDNDIFNRHIDGDWPGYGLSEDRKTMVEWNGVRSKFTMLLYLNSNENGFQGGETILYGKGGDIANITPKTGSALFFRHGFGDKSVLHEGARVTGATPKYVARINVLYRS